MSLSGAPAPPPLGPLGFKPLYQQVKAHLQARMLCGELKPGDLLPSEIQLAATLGVSQGTVRKALNEMAAEHLVERRQGRGTFVARHTSKRAVGHFFPLTRPDGRRIAPTSRIVAHETEPANPVERERLQLDADTVVHRLTRLRQLEGRPVMREHVVLAQALFPDREVLLSCQQDEQLYVLYQSRFDVTVTQVREDVSAVAATQIDADMLEVRVGTPLLLIDRLAFALDGRPVEWRRSRCITGAYVYRHHIG